MNSISDISELSLKATRGMVWSLAENLGLQLVQFGVSIVLARLLLPEHFGLIGILSLFLVIAQTLTFGGFGLALIQKKDASQLDACSVFYFNLLVGVFLTALLYTAAPHISLFYREPLLLPVTRILSLTVIINTFGLVPSSLMAKGMDFKPLVKVSLLSIILAGGVSIAMALMGFGLWSLVAQSLLYSLLRTFLVWQASSWRPNLVFSVSSLMGMFPFGSRILMSGLLDAFFLNIYQPLIGKMYSVADVGYYARAQTTQAAAIQPAGSALGRVLFPALSAIQDDSGRMNRVVRRATLTTVFFYFPLMIGLIVVAEPLIILLMTERWVASIRYFQLLCIAGLFYPLQVIHISVLSATGRSDLLFKLEIIKKSSILLVILITYRWGILSLLYGQIVTSAIAYALHSYYSSRFIGYSLTSQFRDISSSLFFSLTMGVVMYFTGNIVTPLIPRIVFQSMVGLLAYLFLNYTFDRARLSKVLLAARQMMHSSSV